MRFKNFFFRSCLNVLNVMNKRRAMHYIIEEIHIEKDTFSLSFRYLLVHLKESDFRSRTISFETGLYMIHVKM